MPETPPRTSWLVIPGKTDPATRVPEPQIRRILNRCVRSCREVIVPEKYAVAGRCDLNKICWSEVKAGQLLLFCPAVVLEELQNHLQSNQ